MFFHACRRAPGHPLPPPLGPLQGARGVGRDMDWLAGASGFPSTLSRRPQAGDTALTTWLAARRGCTIGWVCVCLHAALGGRYEENGLWGRCRCWVQGARPAARRRGWLCCIAARSRGTYQFFQSIAGLNGHPLPPAPRPPPGGQGSGTRYGLARGRKRLSVHTVAAAASGRHGADNVVGGTTRLRHRAGVCLSPRCPWRETRIYGLPGRAAFCGEGRAVRPGGREMACSADRGGVPCTLYRPAQAGDAALTNARAALRGAFIMQKV